MYVSSAFFFLFFKFQTAIERVEGMIFFFFLVWRVRTWERERERERERGSKGKGGETRLARKKYGV